MEQGFDYSQEMRQWVSPSLIEANYILSLSQQELQAVIEQELLSNPALEIEDRALPGRGSALEGTWCPTCRTDRDRSSNASPDGRDDFEPRVASVASDDDDFDPLSIIASRVDPRETILTDAHIPLDDGEYRIAEFIVESLDERGFLSEDTASIAEALGVTHAAVETVLEVIQDVAPVGVGARDLAECHHLRPLLRRTAKRSPTTSAISSTIISPTSAPTRSEARPPLGVTPADIELARDVIRESPQPAPAPGREARSWCTPTDSPLVSPISSFVTTTTTTCSLRLSTADTTTCNERRPTATCWPASPGTRRAST